MLPTFSSPGLETLHLYLTLAHTQTWQPSNLLLRFHFAPKAFLEDSEQGRLGFPCAFISPVLRTRCPQYSLWVQVIVRPHCQIYGSAALCSHPETYKRRGNHRYLTALQQGEAVTPTTRSRLRLKLRAFIICNYQANYIKTGFGVSCPSGSMSRRVSCRLESSSPVFELQSLGWVLRR